MKPIRVAVLVPLLLVLSLPPALAARRPAGKQEGEAQARREQIAREAEDARAQRLAEVLILEEQERRRRQFRTDKSRSETAQPATYRARPASTSGPGIPGPRARSLPGETHSADNGLDAVFGRDEALRGVDTSRDYPTAIVRSSRGEHTTSRDSGRLPSDPGATAMPSMASAPAGAIPAGSRPSRVSPADSPLADGAVAVPGVTGVELFHQGYSAFSQGDCEGARRSFQQFMVTNPGHDLSDNAEYWTGESWADQGRLEEALAAYQRVIDHFPFGDKVPDALLKSGYVLADLGREAEARDRLQQVVEDFPGTGPARRAEERLAALKAPAAR